MSKKQSFFSEFKTFISRGNVMDLAVGVIVGGAFQKIITSVVNDLVMPVVGLVTGGVNFNDRFFTFDGNTYVTAEAAKNAGVAVFNYGSFLTTTLDFLIMAFVIFLMVKGINKLTSLSLKKKEETSKEEKNTAICPFCQSEISIKACRCPHCTTKLENFPKDVEE